MPDLNSLTAGGPTAQLTNFPKTLLTEIEAAAFLGFEADTLRVWRSKSRRAGRLIGPRWVEIGGEGRRKAIRYRRDDLDAYAAAGAVQLTPRRPRGRPRKVADTR